jgi:hypothetical protein
MSRTVPAPVFQTAGNVVQSSGWNSGPKAMGDFYLSPPIFRAHQSTAQAFAASQYTPLKFDVTDVDTEGGHSNTVNNSRYVCQVAGWYWMEGFAAWTGVPGTDTVWAMASLNSNGSSTPNIVRSLQTRILYATNDFAAVGASGTLKMAVGDVLELYAIVIGVCNTAPNTDLCPSINLVWLHS